MVRQPIVDKSSLRRLRSVAVELVAALDDYLTDRMQELDDKRSSAAPPPTPQPAAVAEPQGSSRLTYSINEAAAALGIGRTTLYKLIREGRLRKIDVLGRVLIPREEIERLTRQ